MDESRNFLTQIVNAFNGLPSDRKIIIAVCLIAIIGVFWLWVTSSGPPNYALLYGDLSLKDSGNIASELQSRNIPYKLADDGRDILVPSDQLLQVRIDLAKEDILPTGSTGFELFDKSNLGLTEFTQHINKQRATQGELERTLMAMDGVDMARVLLNVPEPSPFIEDAQEASASVVVWLSPRYRTLTKQQVSTIQNIVAAAGLPPEKITVSDSKLNPLSGNQEEDELFADAPNRLALKRSYEKQETDKIREFLEKQFGYGNVGVSMSVDLNFVRMELES